MTPTEVIITGLVCAFAGGLAGHWLTLGRDRMLKLESEIRSEKAQFIPVLNQIIRDANADQPVLAWRYHRANLEQSVWRFETFLKGRRKATFAAAWQKCNSTKEEELFDKGQIWFTDSRKAEMEAAQKILTSRVQALLDCVKKA